MEVVKFSQGNKMIRIKGDDNKEAWYFMTPQVQGFVTKSGRISEGSVVTFDAQDTDNEPNTQTITRIVATNGSAQAPRNNGTPDPQPRNTTSNSNQGGGRGNYGGKSAEDREDIRRAVALKAAVELAMVLQGQVDRNEVMQVAKGYYEDFKTLLSQ